MYDSGYISTDDKDIIIEKFKKNEKADRIEAEIISIKMRVKHQAPIMAAQITTKNLRNQWNEIINEANLIKKFDEAALKKAKYVEGMLEKIILMTRDAHARGENSDTDGEDDFEVEDDFDHDL